MKYSAGQAAKAVGVATSTITRALKNGKISGEKQPEGGWLIDPAELHRVFPPVAAQELQQGSRDPLMLESATPELDSRNRGLERLVETLQEEIAWLRQDREKQIEQLQETIADARQDRDHWREKANALLRLMPPPAPEASVEAPSKPVGGFWRRLLGGSGKVN